MHQRDKSTSTGIQKSYGKHTHTHAHRLSLTEYSYAQRNSFLRSVENEIEGKI